MGCHPSHWLSYFSRWLLHHQPDFAFIGTAEICEICVDIDGRGEQFETSTLIFGFQFGVVTLVPSPSVFCRDLGPFFSHVFPMLLHSAFKACAFADVFCFFSCFSRSCRSYSSSCSCWWNIPNKSLINPHCCWWNRLFLFCSSCCCGGRCQLQGRKKDSRCKMIGVLQLHGSTTPQAIHLGLLRSPSFPHGSSWFILFYMG